MKYTLFELIKSNPNLDKKEYKIIIPQIQRDYAQGRKDNTNENKIKSYDFILKLIEVLTSDNPMLNLDFVYGYTKEIGNNQFAFIPLDGQQRLTTLWLLHWYLSPKKEIEQEGIKMLSVLDEIKCYLKNFTYETRNSSKRFCEELIEEYLPVTDNVVETIKDANWFMSSWLNDPTVISMLNMLETIQNLNFDKSFAWKNLNENKKITFDYIDIKSDEFKLTDELYIKMNSRGKPLTSFENFKAQFTEILSAKDTDYVDEKIIYIYYEKAKEISKEVSYCEYFAFNIDTIWTDLFWDFEKTKNEDISFCFMNFFTYIAQMSYFKDNANKNAYDFKNDFSVFKKKSNVLFLFNTLDFLYKISIDESGQVDVNKINTFFENLFQKGNIDNSYQGQVRLFEDNGINLFEKCLLEGSQFENSNRILLYSIISYSIKYSLIEAHEGLRNYTRVVRNLLQATRQRNEIVYNTNVRINSFDKYWKLFEQLMERQNVYECLLEAVDNERDDALNNEREKAQIIMNNTTNDIFQTLFKMEEYKHFGGLIHNLKPTDNISKFINWVENIREIWSCKDKIIAASMIACGFKGIYTKNCRLGEMWFCGKGDNWNTILAWDTKTNDNISNPLIKLLINYDNKKLSNPTQEPNERLESIIKEFIVSLIKRNWQYYFCKYNKYFLNESNYFSWRNDFECEILGSTGYNPLLSYHINPYVKQLLII